MRPSMVYRILLLLCALAAADTMPKCDRSLIRGVTDEEIEWKQNNDGGTVIIKCVNADGAPGAIMHNSTRLYYHLKCDSNGWTGFSEEYVYHPIAKAREPLDVSCDNYCEISIYSSGVRQDTTFVGSEKYVEISCENENLELEQRIRVPGDRARCSRAGWKDGYNASWTDGDLFGQTSFTCKEVARCSTQGGHPRVEISDQEREDIFGESISGWKHRCTQSDNALTAITAHSKRYRVLLCMHQPPQELNGWIGTDNLWTEAHITNIIASKDERLDIACVDYCKVAGTATNITWTETEIRVECKKRSDYLIYGGERVIPGGVTFCNQWKGWMIGAGSDKSNHVPLTDDTDSAAQFDCSPNAPTTTLAPTTTTTTTTTTVAPEPVADSTTAPGGVIAIILLLAAFRSLFMSN